MSKGCKTFGFVFSINVYRKNILFILLQLVFAYCKTLFGLVSPNRHIFPGFIANPLVFLYFNHKKLTAKKTFFSLFFGLGEKILKYVWYMYQITFHVTTVRIVFIIFKKIPLFRIWKDFQFQAGELRSCLNWLEMRLILS